MNLQDKPYGKHAQKAETLADEDALPTVDSVERELEGEGRSDAAEPVASGLESATGDAPSMEDGATEALPSVENGATEVLSLVEDGVTEVLPLVEDGATEEISPVEDGAPETLSPAEADATEVIDPVEADATEVIAPIEADATELIDSVEADATEVIAPIEAYATEVISPIQDDVTEPIASAADDVTELIKPVADEAAAGGGAGKSGKASGKSKPKHARSKEKGQQAGDMGATQRIDVLPATGASQGAGAFQDDGASQGAGGGLSGAGASSTYGSDASAMPGAIGAAGASDAASPGGYVAAGFGEMPSKRRMRGLKVFGITLGVVIVVLLAAYLAGAAVFMGRFLPNTSIGGKDISLKTDAEVADILEDVVSDYQLDVVGGGFSYRMSSSDIGLALDTNRILKSMHADLDAWRWPLLIIEPSHDETSELQMSYKKNAYEPKLSAEVDKFNETAADPVNATIAYDDKTETFVVQPEVPGTKLNKDAVLKSTAETIDELGTKVTLGSEHLVAPAVLSTDQKLIDAAQLATGMVSAHLDLYMGGQLVGQVDGTALSPFVSVNENYEVTFNDEEMNNWVDAMADSFNTLGTERVYTRPDGKQIAVSGGAYGWEVDRDQFKEVVLDGIRAGKPAEVGVPCLDTAQVYNGPNKPDWGARYIDVDLSEQYVRFYGDDGEIIWEAPCISGAPDGKHDTGLGVWCVNAKESPSKLIGYENGKKIYETSVTYWMPFEGNGIGFHDATWQPSFGGSMYADGYGSHGCVNLSYSAAESLYGIIEPGDVVIVHW